MSEEKSPDKLPVSVVWLCSAEKDARDIAVEYNNLKPNDSKRRETYQRWKEASSRAFWD